MTGCYTCGGFGNRHDPIAHDSVGNPGDYDEPVPTCVGCGAKLTYSRWLVDDLYCSDECGSGDR